MSKQLDELLKRKQVKHALNGSFQWLLPYALTAEDLHELKLVKGVAMSEGQLKDGSTMTRDNVLAGAGAMRASAILGAAQLDIDHYETELPERYSKKYGAEIADPYPPGIILDAQGVENEVDGQKIMQVEYIAMMLNDFVYNMIKDHKIKGNSVVDYVRELKCDKCGTDECNCEYDGSAYLYNTLILDEVPNSNSTWVDVITEEDLETLIKNAKGEELQELKHQFTTKPTKIQTIVSHARKKQEYEELHELEGDLDSYMTDGIWNEGEDSIIEYLINEKEIDEDIAKEMAAFLFENPEIMNQYQLRYLSTEDLTAWWNTFNYLNQQLKTVKRNIATLSWLEHNAKPLKQLQKIKQAVQYGQGEVSYGQQDDPDVNCMSCRWFSPHDYEEPAGTGICNIVAGDVEGVLGCDQFAENPLVSGGEEPTDEPEGEEPPMDEPGEEPEQPDEVEPDENGECPDGYMLSEDGTVCIRAMSNNNDGQQVPVPATKHKIKHNAKIEKNPESIPAKQAALIDQQIQELKTKQKRLTLELNKISPFHKKGKERHAELEKITKEIKRLETLKKK